MNSLPLPLTNRPAQSLAANSSMALTSNRWTKRLLLLAATWNIVGGIGALIDPAANLSQLYPGAPTLDHPVATFFFRCTWINVIAWGVGYLIAAHAPASRQAILTAGGLGKIAYFAGCLSLFANGAKPAVAITGALDVLFAAGFAWILFGSSPSPHPIEAPRTIASPTEVPS
jgi:hypothetical protein